MTQLTLGLTLDGAARFSTFVAGANEAPFRHLQSAAAAEPPGELLWVWGAPGAGKTHLLQAACRAADAAGRRAMYVPCGAPGAEDPALLAGLEGLDLLALDLLERVAGDAAWELRLFALLEARREAAQTLLLAARGAPGAIGFALPDLASRAAAAVVYRLAPLADEQRCEALMAHARARGIELDPAVAQYLLSRVGRGMPDLTALLDRLDAASLEAQRKLTIPFVRTLIERDA